MTRRTVRLCTLCRHRLTVARLCLACFNEMHTADLARGTTARPATPLLPTIATIPQPPKDHDHD